MIDIVAFTGVDSQTDLDELAQIARQYPLAEFGILVGSETAPAQDQGIFPSLELVERFRERGCRDGFGTAIHLCGRYARSVMEPEPPLDLHLLCNGFGRVQVNLHGDYWDPQRLTVTEEAVRRFMDRTTCLRLILQHRGSWEDVPVLHPNVEYLFDLSEGRGRESFADWPEPAPWLGRMGYAGGLGPGNIGRAIEFADAHPEAALWFDMEGKLRPRGWFDLGAVKAVCAAVWGAQEIDPR